jgi:hypothetical protein
MENRKINYVFVGSLAQNIYAYAQKLYEVDYSNKPYVKIGKEIVILNDVNAILMQLSRQIGDIDVISTESYYKDKDCLQNQKPIELDFFTEEGLKLFRKIDRRKMEGGVEVGLRKNDPPQSFNIAVINGKSYYVDGMMSQANGKLKFLLFDVKRNMAAKVARYSKDIESYVKAYEKIFNKSAAENAFNMFANPKLIETESYKHYADNISINNLFDSVLKPDSKNGASQMVSKWIKDYLNDIKQLDNDKTLFKD